MFAANICEPNICVRRLAPFNSAVATVSVFSTPSISIAPDLIRE
jgi:hypothetical protein